MSITKGNVTDTITATALNQLDVLNTELGSHIDSFTMKNYIHYA